MALLYEIRIGDCWGIFALSISLIVWLSGTLFFCFRGLRKMKRNQEKPPGFLVAFWGVYISFLGLYTVTLIPFEIAQFRRVYLGYQQGAYEVVEGTVEDFVPFIEKKQDESFEVEGIVFSYSPNRLYLGYRTPQAKRRLIQEGDWIRIGYIPMSGYNRIVRIEKELRR